MSFQLVGVPESPFSGLFDLSDAELARMDAKRVVATESNAYPCRISLEDAEVGEELLLLPYDHQPAHSPYRASGPIFVRREARQAVLVPGEVPGYVTRRLMSLRAYDAADLIIDAEVCEGRETAAALARLFSNPGVAYVHLHNARRGCFSCLARRV